MELNKLINCQQYFRPFLSLIQAPNNPKKKDKTPTEEHKQVYATPNVMSHAAQGDWVWILGGGVT